MVTCQSTHEPGSYDNFIKTKYFRLDHNALWGALRNIDTFKFWLCRPFSKYQIKNRQGFNEF